MRWAAAIALLLLLPSLASAQSVLVRSGDHQTFTRFTFSLPSRVGWTLETSDDAVELKFNQSGLTFDVSTVFDRISRDRVGDISSSQEGSAINLALACECEANAFWFGRSMLVLDVSPRDPSVQSESDQTKASATERTAALSLSSQGTGLPRPSVDLPLRSSSAASRLLQNGLDAPGKPMAVKKTDDPETPNQPTQAVLDQTRDELIRQLGRAASQGLLTPRGASIKTPQSVADSDHPEPRNAGQELAAHVPKHDNTERRNINVQTTIDRDFLASLDGGNLILSTSCLEPSRVDVASWGSEAPFWDQIGPLRASMTGEFDRIDKAVIRELAQRYIYFGFGLEAQQLLEFMPPDSEDLDVLSALSRLMEDGSAHGSVLNTQIECDETVALWAVLSHEDLPTDARLDPNAIIRAFSALPPHLRSYTGPLLSERFLKAGLSREGRIVLRILDRIEDTQSPAADMVSAELALADGHNNKAEEHLGAVIEANNTLSPEALVKKIETLIHHDEPVSFDLAQLAAAYAFEHQGTTLGAALSRAHVLALGASAAFDQAYSELALLDAEGMADVTSLRADLAGLLANHAAPVDFLKYVLSGNIGDPWALSQTTSLKIAERLFETGFFERSYEFLARDFKEPVRRSARILRARTALGLERPKQAEVELLGLDGTDVDILRARAKSMAGEHAQAYALFKSAGLDEEARREAWLAGEPSETHDELVDTGVENAGVLSRNRALLEEASATRESLQDLLLQAPSPVVAN